MTIPPSALLPQDMVDVIDTTTGELIRMHASDARHAMEVDPKRYTLAATRPEPQPEPPAEEEPEASDVEQTEEPEERPLHRRDEDE